MSNTSQLIGLYIALRRMVKNNYFNREITFNFHSHPPYYLRAQGKRTTTCDIRVLSCELPRGGSDPFRISFWSPRSISFAEANIFNIKIIYAQFNCALTYLYRDNLVPRISLLCLPYRWYQNSLLFDAPKM